MTAILSVLSTATREIVAWIATVMTPGKSGVGELVVAPGDPFDVPSQSLHRAKERPP